MKLKNKILSAIMAVVASMTFVSMSALAAQSISLNPSATEVKAGDTFTVTVDLNENPGIMSLRLILTADEGLSLTNVADAGVLTGPVLGKDYTVPEYKLYWTDDLGETNIDTDGTVATLTYAVDAEAKPGTYSIDIKCDPASTNNTDWDEIDFGSASIDITVVGDEPEETTTTEYFAATLKWGVKTQYNTGIAFSFTSKDGSATKEVPFGILTIGEGDDVTVALEVTVVPADAELKLTNADWYVAE